MPSVAHADADCIALDASSSIGLGHLMRTAGLRRLLGSPARYSGRYDARLTNDGLTVQRRLFREQNLAARLRVVDSGHVPELVIRQRLTDPSLKVIWIRRGLWQAHKPVEPRSFRHRHGPCATG